MTNVEIAKNQFSFYATQQDLSIVLEAVASLVEFSSSDQEETAQVHRFASSLPELSIAHSGDLNRDVFYFLIDATTTPNVRRVETRSGGPPQILDQLSHPESVILKPGGVLGDYECILGGLLGTISNDQCSVDLCKTFRNEFRKQFKKVRAFYVGNLAMQKLESGVGLTSNIRSPAEYDLQL